MLAPFSIYPRAQHRHRGAAAGALEVRMRRRVHTAKERSYGFWASHLVFSFCVNTEQEQDTPQSLSGIGGKREKCK